MALGSTVCYLSNKAGFDNIWVRPPQLPLPPSKLALSKLELALLSNTTWLPVVPTLSQPCSDTDTVSVKVSRLTCPVLSLDCSYQLGRVCSCNQSSNMCIQKSFRLRSWRGKYFIRLESMMLTRERDTLTHGPRSKPLARNTNFYPPTHPHDNNVRTTPHRQASPPVPLLRRRRLAATTPSRPHQQSGHYPTTASHRPHR